MSGLVLDGSLLRVGDFVSPSPRTSRHEDGRNDLGFGLRRVDEAAQVNAHHFADHPVKREVGADFGDAAQVQNFWGRHHGSICHVIPSRTHATGQGRGHYHELSQFVPPQVRDNANFLID